MMPPVQSTFSNRPAQTPETEAKVTFNVVLIYEDRPTGKRAMAAFRCLADHLQDEFLVRNSLWSLDLLRNPQIRDVAAAETADADMIVVSIHGHKDLPDVVKASLKKWLNRKKTREGALVALVDPDVERENSASPTLAYLRDIADRAKLDFFAHGAELPARRFEASLEQQANTVAGSDRSVRSANTQPSWL
jgi:hypothetical protein